MHIPIFAIIGFFISAAFFCLASYHYGHVRAYKKMRAISMKTISQLKLDDTNE